MGLPIKLKLPEHFLEKEVRCGYEVSEKLKKIWAVELDLLNELIRVCKKHDIKMQVSYGTLLGAVRHGGFIPWDDDLDVWLTRTEYEKLLDIAPKEFEHPYFLQTALNDRKFYLGYARLRNSNTTGAISGEDCADYNNGIYIDVYVIDGFTELSFLYYLQLIPRRVLLKCLTIYGQGKAVNRSLFQLACHYVMRPLVRLIKFETWMRLSNAVTSMYNHNARRYCVVYEMMGKPYKHWITADEWNETMEMKFENLLVPCPKCYDRVLTRMYGDYMTYPPIDQLGKWHEGKIHFEPDIPYKKYVEVRRRD